MVQDSEGMKEFNAHVTHGNHAHRLPDTQTDAGRDTTVQALDAVALVDVLERVADRHLLGTVGVVLLALHLDTDDLDRLVPGRETATNGRGHNLLKGAQLLVLLLAREVADPLLGEAAQTEARAPVGHLANGNGVDALVDAADTLAAVDVHEGGPGAGRLGPRGGHLVLGDLDRLHAGAEAHGRVRLGNTARHAANDAAAKLVGARAAGIVLGLGGDKEQHGALGRRFDPGPGNQTLVDYRPKEDPLSAKKVLEHVKRRDVTYSRRYRRGSRCGREPWRSRHHGGQPWWSW